MTNYLASVNLASLSEALMTMRRVGIDLNTTFEAIRISSGNSFVHETESQVILNGSRNVNFTMDLVVKDLSLFQAIADRADVPLEISPLLLKIFEDGQDRYGGREWSTNIVRRLEDACADQLLAPGFPADLVDEESEVVGQEVVAKRS
jgi:3-hydroxyisobutyrate dehydrogenase